MSTLILAQCWPLRMPPTAKAVLISLADNANDAGHCWPSLTTICERTCFGRTAVIEAIQWLESNGYLRISRDRKFNSYQIIPPSNTVSKTGQFHYIYRITHQPSGLFYIGLRSCACLPNDDDYWGSGKECVWLESVKEECSKEILGVFDTRMQAAESETNEIANAIGNRLCLNKRVSTPGQAIGPSGDQSVSRTVRHTNSSADESTSPRSEPNTSASRTQSVRQPDSNHQEPSLTVIEPSKKKRAKPEPVSLSDLDFSSWPNKASDQVFQAWVAHRQKKKLSLEQIVITKTGNQLAKAQAMGWTVDECLTEAVERGWQGLNADWLTAKRSATGPPNPVKPSVTDSFHGKQYTGTPEHELPDFLR